MKLRFIQLSFDATRRTIWTFWNGTHVDKMCFLVVTVSEFIGDRSE